MSNPTSQASVLIVGGGPTGLTLALSLAGFGVTVRIIEEATTPHEAIRGTSITPRTLELLTILGVKSDFDAIAGPPQQMAIYDSTGMNVLKAFEWSTAAEDTPTIPYRRSATVSQAELEKVLRKHLKAMGILVEMGKRLTGVSQTDKLVNASVTLSDGTLENINCSFLVAADGAKGLSRRFLNIPFIGESKEADRMFTANVEVPGFSREYWHRWGDFTKAAVLLKPVEPAPLYQLQALGPLMQKEIPSDVQSLQKFFNSIAVRDDISFQSAAWITEWKANIRMAERFSKGRVFLAGDVAHCHSPTGGQGTNTAMQDAFNLSWKLALVINKFADFGLLSTYEAERMPVVAEMLNLSNALHARTFSHIPDAAFEVTSASAAQEDPMIRSAKLLQLGINYRWSDIILDPRDTGGQKPSQDNPYGIHGSKLRAGDRAPYFKDGEGGTDLFSLLHEGAGAHVILYFHPVNKFTGTGGEISPLERLGDANLAKVLEISVGSPGVTNPGGNAFLDINRVAYTAYDIDEKETTWVAIRPDGVIGAYVDTVSGLVEYFKKLGLEL